MADSTAPSIAVTPIEQPQEQPQEQKTGSNLATKGAMAASNVQAAGTAGDFLAVPAPALASGDSSSLHGGDSGSVSSSSAQTFDPNLAVTMVTLENILNKPGILLQFQQYLRENLAEETFEFIKQVRHLLAAANGNDLSNEYIMNEAHDIFNRFVAQDAIMEVNLTSRCRKALSETIQAAKLADCTSAWVKSAFAMAEQEVLKLMQGKLYGFMSDIEKPVMSEVMDTITKPGQKRVVVIGGGFAGFMICHLLDEIPRFHVTLIDKKEYMEYTPSMIKTLVHESPIPIQCPHQAYLKNGRFILGYATSVQKEYVVVNNKKIPFDYLAICSGSTYKTYLKSDAMTTNFTCKQSAFERKELETAKSCLVIGGGFVGVEIATEIKSVYPEKEVYLVEANGSILKRCSKSIQQKATEYIQKLGVRLILNERIVDHSNKKDFVTSNGVKINVDKVYIATGPVPHSSFLADGPFKDAVDSHGRIKVDMTLQVEGWKNVFAAGDVCNVADEKMARTAAGGGYVISRNICRMEKGKEPLAMGAKYMPNTIKAPSYLFLSLGTKDAMYIAHLKRGYINQMTLKVKNHFEGVYMKVFNGKARVPNGAFGRPPHSLDPVPNSEPKPLIILEESTPAISMSPSMSSIALTSNSELRLSVKESASTRAELTAAINDKLNPKAESAAQSATSTA